MQQQHFYGVPNKPFSKEIGCKPCLWDISFAFRSGHSIALRQNKKMSDRLDGKIILLEDSVSSNLCFGFGRIQRKKTHGESWEVLRWKYHGQDMPTINFKPFTKLNISLQSQLFRGFEIAQLFADTQIHNASRDKVQRNI